ncbi:hypothetical protein OAP63_15335 [Vibrio sp.]|uniref:Uncharacterized protein n=1 Tax=Vibrio viridaestus TaxID=2487322 RepID=A0A3N9TIR5_9VIBR|nr:hypothetical protein [Vibrio viridaestus]MDC0612104.1 hypothetical protein [Vibrio sp.]RQW63435.1 hypothetical protein EES38_09310 [Vibrio viridaestus]
MKRSSSAYRLQMIKEVATRNQHHDQNVSDTDPMADYIKHLLVDKPKKEVKPEMKRSFNGAHFDEKSGGWVSDRWK